MRGWLNLQKSSWHRSISLLWVMIIALQWVSYTDSIWLTVTTALVSIVLTTVAVIEILLPVRWIYRLLMEAIAIVYIMYRTLIHYGIYLTDPMLTLREELPNIAAEMLPYLWFVLGAWGLLLLSSWWVSSKARILLFIGMNIAAFAALDSFTPSILWQEVAWTVFAAMGWLVTQHLRNFQLQYPNGWSYLLDYPIKVVVNIAIIFSLVIITGVNMPEVSPTLTDPYTAWKDWNGTGTSSGSRSKGISQTDNGNTAVNNTTSGYSMDDGNLGGGFSFDYSPVMTVTSDLRTYMRGETRSVYSGSGWTDNDRINRGPLKGASVGEGLETTVATKVQYQALQQTVKLLNNNDYPVLFGPYAISKVESVNGENSSNGLFWRSRDSELLWDTDENNRKYPLSYELTAEVPVIPVQELTAKTYAELYDGNTMDKQFLQLPDKFPARVKELAEEITATGQTPYEKTALLQQYLQETFPYTNEPDLTRSTSSDFVDSFLFEVREGYCDYYSTALVTMARSLNIPARWVKGYAPGEQAQLPDNMALQQGRILNNNYTITNADAHSWAEVYFGEYGWIPVEATPGFNVPLLTQNENTPDSDHTDQEENEPDEATAVNDGAGQTGFHLGDWAVVAAAAVLLAWLTYLVWQQRFNLRFLVQRLRNRRPLTPDQKIVAETELWIRYIHRKGLTKEEHETLREAVGRWSRERPAIAEILYSLLVLFEQAKYSPDVIEDKDWRRVYTEALRLRKSMKSKN
ncbi:transglutaminase [Paenibacillus sp. LC-T2]|uniref:Transglutaminase n=2 Tax=Paenibacillus monticola TaxID=2666075 RepID=A0A7X2H2N0_9BACL|nr:transglutaminase [Paenibacillus monticola]